MNFSSCAVADAEDFDYLPTNNKAVRFKFTIGQLSGSENQVLYLHCKMTTCQRDEVLKMRKFNCRTQSQYCPHQKDSDITIGPFIQVQLVELRQTRKTLKIKNSEYEKLCGLERYASCQIDVAILKNLRNFLPFQVKVFTEKTLYTTRSFLLLNPEYLVQTVHGVM